MTDWRQLEPRCLGRWPDILAAFGVEVRKLNKNGPCPNCGGNDRAHFFERDGRILLYCRHGCGNAGDGNCVSTPEYLLQERNGWSFRQMVQEVARYFGEDFASVPIAPIRSPSQPSYSLPASHRTDPAKTAEQLQRTNTHHTHKLFVMENTAPRGDVLDIAGKLVVPMHDHTGELVNLAAFSADGQKVYWSAGGPSFSATARIPAALNDCGRVILCCDYFAAWRLWWKLKGECEVRATISPDVFIWQTRKMRDQFDTVAVHASDVDEYEEMGFDVLELQSVYEKAL